MCRASGTHARSKTLSDTGFVCSLNVPRAPTRETKPFQESLRNRDTTENGYHVLEPGTGNDEVAISKGS